MKKNFKLVLALVLSIMMIAGMIPAMAETTTQTISITGLETGDKVTFYKVLEWSASDDDPDAVGGWKWVEPFKTAFSVGGDNGKAKLEGAISALPEYKLMITDTLAGELARALNTSGVTFSPVEANVSEESGTATHTFSAIEVGATTNDGLYMAIITPATQGTQYNPVFVRLDSSNTTDSYAPTSESDYYNTGAAKKSTHTIDKESHNPDDYTNNNDEEASSFYTTDHDDGDTAKIGDVLQFKVSTQIPGYGNIYQAPFFKITDTLKDLKLVVTTEKPFVVKVGGQVVAAGDTTYTISGNTSNSTLYTIDFKPAYLNTLNVATDLTIEYYAEVATSALANINKEKNTVELDYSHNPTTETDGRPGGYKKWEKDVTNHYTFSIDADNLVDWDEMVGESSSEIIKIGVDSNGNPIKSEIWTSSNVTVEKHQKSPLANAEFSLFKTNESGTKTGEPIMTGLKSDANGRIKITGLDAGKYVLVETKAPTGYVKISADLPFEIKAKIEEREITEWYDQAGNWYETKALAEAAETAASGATDLDKKVGSFTYTAKELAEYKVIYNGGEVSHYTFNHVFESETAIKWGIPTSSEAPASIPNVKGVELPHTGGIGTTLFYVGGSILVLAAAILLITKRRMSSND